MKSASVSSPGPSAADNNTASTQQSEGARYKSHSQTQSHLFMSIKYLPKIIIFKIHDVKSV